MLAVTGGCSVDEAGSLLFHVLHGLHPFPERTDPVGVVLLLLHHQSLDTVVVELSVWMRTVVAVVYS